MRKSAYILLSSLMVSASAFAQGVVSNEHFIDNTFIQVGGGVNAMHSTRYNDRGISTRLAPAVEISLGKWLTPELALRAGYQGFQMAPKTGAKLEYSYLHGDLLFNALNIFQGYMPGRSFALVPYAHIGLLSTVLSPSLTGHELAAGVGLMGTYHFTDRLGMYLDFRPMFFKQDIGGKANGGSNPADNIVALAGVTYGFGRTEWGNVSIGSVRGSDDEQDGSRTSGMMSNGFIDNTFVEAGAGVSSLAEDGGANLAFDFAAGKWFGPNFGTRIGLQGFQLTSRGKNRSYINVHGDVLFNLSNMLAGYKADRFWNIAPYLSAGAAHSSFNEFAVGGGLYNTFQIAPQLGIYADLRAMAAHNRLVQKSGKAAVDLSALVGVYYAFGNADWQPATIKVKAPKIAKEKIEKEANMTERVNRNAGGIVANEGFWDNTFVEVGGGLNALYTMRYGNTGVSGSLAPAIDVAFAKWLNPYFGLRAGFMTGQMAPKSMARYDYSYIHGDVMLDARSAFSGYMPGRIWDVAPYMHVGMMFSDLGKGLTGHELASGFGILNQFHLNDHIALFLDLRETFFKQDISKTAPGGSNITGNTSLLGGVTYAFGRTEWGTTQRGSVIGREGEINGSSSNGDIENSFWDNTFVEAGLGASVLAKNSDPAFAIDLAAGKWITPLFGVRVGAQGYSLKYNGRTVPYFQGHGDLMMNLSQLIAGYKADRFWTIAPYVSAGLARSSHNEFTAGGGILNQFRFTSNLGAFVDLRANAVQSRLFARNGISMDMSAFAGLYFMLGEKGWNRGQLRVEAPVVTVNRVEESSPREGIVSNEGFWDNTFMEIGGGVNGLYSMRYVDSGLSPRVAPAVDFAFGKWINPYFGLRLGFMGGQFAPKSYDHYDMTYLHGDVMLNARNAFTGYMPGKVWDAVPYLHIGLLSSALGGGLTGHELGSGVGLLNQFRLTNKIGLFLDVRELFFKQDLAKAAPGGSNLTAQTSVLAGFTYSFGRNEWGTTQRGSVYGREGEKVGSITTGEIENGFWDNTFVQAGLGASVLAKNSNPMLAVDLAAGKWISPVFGVRVGAQGYRLNYAGKNVPYFHGHGDFLVNASNIVAGYKADRFWTVAPYMSAGLARSSHNEFTAGGGLLNLFRITSDMGAYIDLRAAAVQSRVFARNGFSLDLSAFAGLYFNIGDQGWQRGKLTIERDPAYKGIDREALEGIVTNDGFWDNTFVQFGGGVNAMYSTRYGDTGLSAHVAPAVDIAFGKWITPGLGLRVGYQGASFAPKNADKYASAYLHGDVLLNLRNLTSGYIPGRFWEVSPYLHVGLLASELQGYGVKYGSEFAAGFGILNQFRISDKVGMYLDFRPALFKQDVAPGIPGGSNLTDNLAVTAGLAYNFGRTQWGSSIGGTVFGADKESVGKKTSGEIINEFWDNTFVQIGGGVSEIVGKGGITPAYNIAFGKWLTPYVGARVGLQGFSADIKGKGHDLYAANADVMLGLRDIIAGYKADRFWNIAPYASAGLMRSSHNEVSLGAGLLNTFQLAHQLGVFVDLRAMVVEGREFGLGGGAMLDASALAGVYFNFGRNSWNTESMTVEKQQDDFEVKSVKKVFTSKNILDNVFVQMGAGVNALHTPVDGDNFALNSNVAPAIDFGVGKWVSPFLGVRLGYQGGSFAPFDKSAVNGRSHTSYVNAAVLWNAANSLFGYKQDRFWELNPYAHLGLLSETRSIGTDHEFAGGVGLLNNFRISQGFGVYVDLREMLYKGYNADSKKNIAAINTSVLLGLTYNFGNFGRFGWSEQAIDTFKEERRSGNSRFMDDTFMSLGVGVNTLVSPIMKLGFNGAVTPTLDLAFGKWLTRNVGVRLGYQGARVAEYGNNPVNAVATDSFNGKAKYKETAGIAFAHADLLWDARNTFNGFSRSRVWNPIPYASLGMTDLYSVKVGSKENNWEFAVGAGLLNNFRINGRMNAFVDLRADAFNTRGFLDARSSAAPDIMLSALAGLSFNLGDVTDMGWITSDMGDAERFKIQRQKLVFSNAFFRNFGHNTFVTIAGGANLLYTPAEKIGFNAVLAPAEDLTLGKWFNPMFGARLGLQGVNVAQWGSDNLINENMLMTDGKILNGHEVYREEAGFCYVHGDFLWNATNALFGYNPERRLTIAPYVHAGMRFEHEFANLSDKSYERELAAGVGLLTGVRIADKASLNLDLRAAVLHGDYLINKNDGLSALGTAMLGVTYDLGRQDWVSFSKGIYEAEDAPKAKFFDNTFVALGLGANKLMVDGTGSGSALDINFGKWFSPNFGARIGYQGLEFDSSYSYNYAHADVLWHSWNSFFGENRERMYNLIPYFHTGLAMSTALRNREFQAGVGLLNNFRLPGGLGVNVDLRAGAMAGGRLTHGLRSGAYNFVLAGIVGMTYDLGNTEWKEYTVNYREDDENGNVARKWAISTNILDYANMGTVNAEVQYGLGRHFSLDTQVKLNAWKFGYGSNAKMDQKQTVAIGAKYWPWYLYSGVWFRGTAQVERYRQANKLLNLEKGNSTFEIGDKYGAGLSLGYSLMIKQWLNIDFGVGFWGGYKHCVQYDNARFEQGVKPFVDKSVGKMFFEPNNVSISAMFVF